MLSFLRKNNTFDPNSPNELNKQRLMWTFAKFKQRNKETYKETKNQEGQETKKQRNEETSNHKTSKKRNQGAKKHRNIET